MVQEPINFGSDSIYISPLLVNRSHSHRHTFFTHSYQCRSNGVLVWVVHHGRITEHCINALDVVTSGRDRADIGQFSRPLVKAIVVLEDVDVTRFIRQLFTFVTNRPDA